MKAQSGRTGKGGSGQRLGSERAQAKVNKAVNKMKRKKK